MMTSRRERARPPGACAVAGALWLLLGATIAHAAPRAAMTPAALGPIEPGLWEMVADGEPTRAICVADPVALTQIRHGAAACTRLVIADEGTSAVVHYSCPGAGWGRTSLRVESPRAVRIDTQGIAGSAPFAFAGEARRTGACGGTNRSAAAR